MIWKERKLGNSEKNRILKHIQSETYNYDKYEAQKNFFSSILIK